MTNNKNLPTALLTERQVADLTGLAPGSLRNMRSERRGPQFVKLGSNGVVRYRPADIDAWISSQLIKTRD